MHGGAIINFLRERASERAKKHGGGNAERVSRPGPVVFISEDSNDRELSVPMAMIYPLRSEGDPAGRLFPRSNAPPFKEHRTPLFSLLAPRRSFFPDADKVLRENGGRLINRVHGGYSPSTTRRAGPGVLV